LDRASNGGSVLCDNWAVGGWRVVNKQASRGNFFSISVFSPKFLSFFPLEMPVESLADGIGFSCADFVCFLFLAFC
jgi:hypothetical protein